MNIFMEVILQTFLAFFSILIIARVLGRQQVAELTFHEYINGITLGSIAAALATDLNNESWPHFAGLVLFGVLTYMMSFIYLKSRKASKFLQGEPVLVIQDGRIFEKNLHKFHYTVDDLTHLLRKKDVFKIKDVKYAILETTGELSVLKIAEKQPVTVKDMKLSVEQEDLETDIIVTGNIVYENLRKRNLTSKWLLSQLKMMGIKDIKDIYFATLDKDNKIYIDLFNDNLKEPSDITDVKHN